jgi:cytochrome P450
MAEDDRRTRPAVAIDVESADHVANWEATSRQLRSQCPMAWSTEHGGYWLVTRYEDVLRVAQDPAGFTSSKTFDPATGVVEGGVAIPPMPIGRLIPAETDKPEWEMFRTLLNPRLSPNAAEGFRADAETYAALLLDQVIESGRMDLVQDFTSPLTALVTMQALGFPLEEWRAFADPLHALTALNKSDPAYPAAVAAAAWVDRRIDEEIARRKAEPIDDILDHLVAARVDGEPLADADIHQAAINLLFGGVDTTTALTSNTLVHLGRHPDQRARLAADRSLMTVAREEFIRFFTPAHGSARTAQVDACIAGQEIAAGDKLYLFFASANRDAEIFERPDEIDITRFPNRHIGFGAGIHRCIGSFLARMTFEVMMNAVLDRLPDYAVIEEGAARYPSISPINGWVNIPLTFPPGPRSGLAEPAWLHAAAAATGHH